MALENKNISGPDIWTYDTAASIYITAYLELLEDATLDYTKVRTVSGKYESALYQGKITIKQDEKTITFSNVLYIPTAPENLLSGQML